MPSLVQKNGNKNEKHKLLKSSRTHHPKITLINILIDVPFLSFYESFIVITQYTHICCLLSALTDTLWKFFPVIRLYHYLQCINRNPNIWLYCDSLTDVSLLLNHTLMLLKHSDGL